MVVTMRTWYVASALTVTGASVAGERGEGGSTIMPASAMPARNTYLIYLPKQVARYRDGD
jgi:hypothetical protein